MELTVIFIAIVQLYAMLKSKVAQKLKINIKQEVCMKIWLSILFFFPSLLAMEPSSESSNSDVALIATRLKSVCNIKPNGDTGPTNNFDYLPFDRPPQMTDRLLEKLDLNWPVELTVYLEKFCNQQLQQFCSSPPMQKQFIHFAQKLLASTTTANVQNLVQTIQSLEHPHLIFQTTCHLRKQFPSYTNCATLTGHAKDVFCLAHAITKPLLASGSADTRIKLWKTHKQQHSEVKTLIGHTGYVHSVGFMPQETHLASGAGDGTVRQWDIQKGITLAQLQPKQTNYYSIRDLAVLDDNTIFAGSENSEIYAWDLNSQKYTVIPSAGTDRTIFHLMISEDKNYLVVGKANEIQIIDRRTETTVKEYKGLPSNAFLATQGDTVISGGFEGTINVLHMKNADAKPLETIKTDSNILAGTIDPSTQHVVLIATENLDENIISCWNPQTKKCINTINTNQSLEGVRSLICDSSGTLYSASEDRSIRIHHPLAQEELLLAYAKIKSERQNTGSNDLY